MIDERSQPEMDRPSPATMLEGRRERVPTGAGITLSVLRWDGRGVPFLLVHGLASNARLWEGVAAELAAAGHDVTAVDLRGHGESDRPTVGYDFETVVADLAGLVERLGLDRPVLVGQSWGADVVLEVAVRQPGLARGIGCLDGAMADLADRFPTWKACWEQLAPPPLDGVPASRIEAYIESAHPDWPAWGTAAVMANFDRRADGTVAPRLTRERHMTILRALWEHRPSALWPLLRIPALVLPADTGDVGWSAEKRRAVGVAAATNPLLTVRWFSPADHDVHVQQARAVAVALREALAGWSDA
ncbi:MAG: alpha/beta fold hydrolase [Candidatus Limnocylindrales bacterium]